MNYGHRDTEQRIFLRELDGVRELWCVRVMHIRNAFNRRDVNGELHRDARLQL